MTTNTRDSEPDRRRRALPLVGAHMSSAGGLAQVTERALAVGAEVVQIFDSNPRTWRAIPPDPEVLAASAARLREKCLPLFFHTIYLVNLASPDRELRHRSTLAVAQALVSGALAGATGIVTHVGSHRGQGFKKASSWTHEALDRALDAAKNELVNLGDSDRCRTLPPLLLETSTGSGNTVGDNLADLAFLLDPTGSTEATPGIPELGLCLDTAHLFAAGYAVHQPQGLEDLLTELRQRRLMRKVRLVHLNDSAATFGSKRDRHANIGEGEIGYAALAHLLRHPALAHVPFVLEVPGLDRRGPGRAEIALVKTMRQGVRPPLPLPSAVDKGPPAQA